MITVYAKQIAVTSHVLTKDGDVTPIPHVWLTSADSKFLMDDIMMYSNAPLAALTKYRVKIAGTFIGGAKTDACTSAPWLAEACALISSDAPGSQARNL